jgi:2-oxoglutarate dehydrogenase complex dehydrogenase (E1) component-like enzyme
MALEELKKTGVLKNYRLGCVSRKNSASPAVGKKSKHDLEQTEILKELFK